MIHQTNNWTKRAQSLIDRSSQQVNFFRLTGTRNHDCLTLGRSQISSTFFDPLGVINFLIQLRQTRSNPELFRNQSRHSHYLTGSNTVAVIRLTACKSERRLH